MKKKHPISKSSQIGVEFFANLFVIFSSIAIAWAATVHLEMRWALLLSCVVGLIGSFFIPKIHAGLHCWWWRTVKKHTSWWIYGFTTKNSSGEKIHVIGTFQVVNSSPNEDLVITGMSHEFETTGNGDKHLKPRIEWQAKFANDALAQNDFLIIYEVTHDYTGVGYQLGLFWLYHPNTNVKSPLGGYITDFHTGRVQSIDKQVEFDHTFAAKIKHRFRTQNPNNEVAAFLEKHAPALVAWMNQSGSN